MHIQYAVFRQREQTFAIVLVQKRLLDDRATAERALAWLESRHFHMPTALMARNAQGIPGAYYGRGDLALMLSRIPPADIQWQQATLGQHA